MVLSRAHSFIHHIKMLADMTRTFNHVRRYRSKDCYIFQHCGMRLFLKAFLPRFVVGARGFEPLAIYVQPFVVVRCVLRFLAACSWLFAIGCLHVSLLLHRCYMLLLCFSPLLQRLSVSFGSLDFSCVCSSTIISTEKFSFSKNGSNVMGLVAAQRKSGR